MRAIVLVGAGATLMASAVLATSGERARADAPVPAARVPAPASAAGPVDSALPIPELIRRFQARTLGGGAPPTSLSGGASSVDSLLHRYVAALDARDRDAAVRLSVTASEFGVLYYPESPYARPPYNLPPDFVWMFLEENGAKGLRLAVRGYGGDGWRYQDHDCGPRPRTEGVNRVWGPCTITLRSAAGATVRAPLANAVLERAGRFKLLGLANGL